MATVKMFSALQQRVPEPLLKLAHNLVGVARTLDTNNVVHFGAALAKNAGRIATTRNLRPADEAMRGRTTTFKVDGTEVTLSGDDFSSAREMYCRRVYLSHPPVHLRPGSTVLDLGANIGLFSLLAARRGCKVIAVEAQRGFVLEIQKRLRAAECEHSVEIECALIGSGTGVFATPADVSHASHYEPGQEVPSIDMPTLLKRHGISRIDFLKADIEGAEFALFAEYAPWMRQVDQIAMELHGQFGRADQIAQVLRQAGFQTAVVDDVMRPVADLGAHAGYVFAWRT